MTNHSPFRRNLRCLLWVVLCGCLAAEVFPASSSWYSRVWQSDEDLPDNSVTGVAQSPEGYLWVATLDGLARFDGVRFQKTGLLDLNASINPMIRAMHLGAGNQIWLALEGGVVMSLGPAGTNIFTTRNGLPAFRPMTIVQSGDKNIWISYADGSACRISQGRVSRFRARDGLSGMGHCWLATDREGLLYYAKAGKVGTFSGDRFSARVTLGDRTIRLAASRAGGVWVCSENQLYRMGTNATLIKEGSLPQEGLPAEPTVLYEDRLGALWIGTSAHGLYRFAKGEASRVETSQAEIRSIYEDREENLWIGTTGGGLNRIRARVVELHDTEVGLPQAPIRSVCQDPSGKIWAAAQNGGLFCYQNDRWSNVSEEVAPLGDKVTTVVADRGGSLWIGTYRGGLLRRHQGLTTSFRKDRGLAGESVRALFCDSRGALWIGTETSNTLQRLQDNRFETFALPVRSAPVRTIAEDSAHVIWAGTADGVLLRLADGKLSDETRLPDAKSKPIRCVASTDDGSLWIGFAGSGLGRIKGGKFSCLDTRQGLHDDYVSQIVPDGVGGLWLAGNKGISLVGLGDLERCMENRAERVRSRGFGKDEGLPNLQANYGHAPAALRSSDGRIWLSTRTGLAVATPLRSRTRHLPPPVTIEQIRVDGAPIPFADGRSFLCEENTLDTVGDKQAGPIFSLPPGFRKLEIEYTALTFIASEAVQFRHRLEGLEEEWSEAGTRRTTVYSRLPAGQYRFRVLACNSSGVWNSQGAGVTIAVQPFFWQSWWFRSAALAAFALGITAVVRYISFRRLKLRLQQVERQAALHRERARIARDIHDDIGASLTQINLISQIAQRDVPDAAKTRSHLANISGAARQIVKSMEEIVWAVNPQNDTFAHLAEYIGQYAVDYLAAADIRCRVDFPENLPGRDMTAELRHNLFLVIKEALHNIVKHSHATEVRLQIACLPTQFTLSIEDNGCGLKPTPLDPQADGLANIRQRIREIGGTIEMQGSAGKGLRLVISLNWTVTSATSMADKSPQ